MAERQGGTWSSVCVWAWWRIKWEQNAVAFPLRWRFTQRFTHTIKQRNIKSAGSYFGKKFYCPLCLFNERKSFAQSVCWCVPTRTLLQSRLFTFIAEEFVLFLMVLFSTNAACEITCSGSQDGTICKNLLPLKIIVLVFFLYFFFKILFEPAGDSATHYYIIKFKR